MTLHQLKVFTTVVKIKSFTRAAERLGVRQPSVSLVIKDLEQDLQVRLFEKLGHKINLTAAGKLLLQDAETFQSRRNLAIASPRHPLANKGSIPLMRLARESIITEERGGSLERELLEERFAKLGIPFTPHLELSPRIGSRDAIRSAAAGGLGIGFITKCRVQADVEAGRLEILKVPDLKLKRSNYIAVHKSRQKSPLVQAFIKLLKQYKGKTRD